MIHIKTWEIIKALTENTTLKFKPNGQPLNYVYLKNNQLCWSDGELFDLNTKDEVSGLAGTINYEWELVSEPVDFITAINSGKRVRSELWKSGDFINTNIPKDSWHRVTTDEINGKWYIE